MILARSPFTPPNAPPSTGPDGPRHDAAWLARAGEAIVEAARLAVERHRAMLRQGAVAADVSDARAADRDAGGLPRSGENGR